VKKIVVFLSSLAILFTMSVSASAGSIPEELLSNNDAKLYIGRVDARTTLAEGTLPYEENRVLYIDITPTYKYKGDVKIGEAEKHTEHNFGSFIPEKDKEYLFGYIDENNFYVYEIESRNEDNIKLLDSDKYDMTKRLEDYINEGAFAMAEEERLTIGKQISLVEFLYKKPSLSSQAVKKVTMRYQDDLCEVDKDKFFLIAEEIMITGAKNEMLYEVKFDSKTPAPYETVLYIELLDENDQCVYYGAVSRFGEVDRYSLSMSRLMQKDYEMKKEDLSKLYSLFPQEIQNKLAKPESLSAIDETSQAEISNETSKDYKGIILAGVLVAIALIAGFAVKARLKK